MAPRMTHARWQKILGSKSLQKFGELLSASWGLDVAIFSLPQDVYDVNTAIGTSNLMGFLPKLQRPLCKAVFKQEHGVKKCWETFQEAAVQGQQQAKPFKLRCHLGLYELMVPIIVHGELVGGLAIGGFVDQHESHEHAVPSPHDIEIVIQRASELGISDRIIHKGIKALPGLTPHMASMLGQMGAMAIEDLMEMVADMAEQTRRIKAMKKRMEQFDDLIGKSEGMQQIFTLLEKVAPTDATVLITGESGTGKGLIAKSIHSRSPRKKKAMYAVNCSAFNENLLESELFGHVRGAFTGATADRKGVFESAHKSSLFLDEIGDMSLAMQAKLLHVLQEGTFYPVGSTMKKSVNVRIIAATNKDLAQMVKEGAFREDLYYRLKVISLKLPSLRERREDIPLLVKHYLKEFSGNKKKKLTREVEEAFYNYNWPGNIRELKHELQRIVVLSGNDETIEALHLSADLINANPKISGRFVTIKKHSNYTMAQAVSALEREVILTGLERTGGNKTKLADELGITRQWLNKIMKKLHLDR